MLLPFMVFQRWHVNVFKRHGLWVKQKFASQLSWWGLKTKILQVCLENLPSESLSASQNMTGPIRLLLGGKKGVVWLFISPQSPYHWHWIWSDWKACLLIFLAMSHLDGSCIYGMKWVGSKENVPNFPTSGAYSPVGTDSIVLWENGWLNSVSNTEKNKTY